MDTNTIAILIPIVYALTEAYKLVMKKAPVSAKVLLWMGAFVPLFALVSSVLIALILSFDITSVLNGLVAGLSAIGLYDGVKYSHSSIGKLSK